jgi:pilus assembly protein Flp/PilA
MYLKLLVKMQQLMNREEGQSLVEYGLIVALIAVVSIGIITTLGTNIQAKFTTISNAI